jgi:hypothetical protein
MELIKMNEAYNLVDNPENGWKVQGQVIKEQNGTLRINFSVALENDNHLGSYNYDNYSGSNSVHVSSSCVKENSDEFINYGQELVNLILEQLN